MDNRGFSLVIIPVVVFILGTISYFGFTYYRQNFLPTSYDKYSEGSNTKITDSNPTQTYVTKTEERNPRPTASATEIDQLKKKPAVIILIIELQNALLRYRVVNGTHPDTLYELIPSEISTIPIDPITQQPFSYQVNADKSDYVISGTFEDGSSYMVTSTTKPETLY